MTRVVLALGSNLGDRLANLRSAVRLLRERGVSVERVSQAWETDPVPADQPAYLNGTVVGDTALSPAELLEVTQGIERELGRVRNERRWGPRPIDIDVLFYGEERIESEDLTVPHPRIAERAFVLAPLAEVWEGPLPVFARAAAEMLEAVGRMGLRHRLGPIEVESHE